MNGGYHGRVERQNELIETTRLCCMRKDSRLFHVVFSKGDPGDKARIPAQDSVLVKTVERRYGMQASNNAFLSCVILLVDLQIVAIIKRFYIMEYAI